MGYSEKEKAEAEGKRKDALARGKLWSYGYKDTIVKAFKADTNATELIFQYDIEMFLFLHYDTFPTHVPRWEHLLRAAEIRWPTKQLPNGGQEGKFVRHSWAELFAEEFTGNERLNVFGGAGQGKTTMFVGFAILCWDYYSLTTRGAKVRISSVVETKLKQAAWAEVSNLYPRDVDQPIFSINAARGTVLSDLIVKRAKPYDKDLRSSIMGVLLSPTTDDRSQIDKLTGGHVPTFSCYIVDEAQSTRTGPIQKAASNVFMHCKMGRLVQLGNPYDTQNIFSERSKPVGGWSTVNKETKYWYHKDESGLITKVIHVSNEDSPGVVDPVRYWFTPTQAKCEREFGSPPNKESLNYIRMWMGWFTDQSIVPTITSLERIKSNNCHLSIDHSYIPVAGKSLLSVDPAPASLDRSMIVYANLVIKDRIRYINFGNAMTMKKVEKPDYYKMLTAKIKAEVKNFGIPKGSIPYDNTSLSGIDRLLQIEGLDGYPIMYNEGATEKFVLYSRSNGTKSVMERANIRCRTKRAEMLLLLRNFIEYGQIRGLNSNLGGFRGRDELTGDGRVEEDICSLLVDDNPDEGRFIAETTLDFRARKGFSPDLLMCLAQACLYARNFWGMIPGKLYQSEEEGDDEVFKSFLTEESIYAELLAGQRGFGEDEVDFNSALNFLTD